MARLHKDLSQDVRGRDASLIQDMWEGIWEVGDEARLLLDSQPPFLGSSVTALHVVL